MSMNLHFRAGSDELDTWQTPTVITYLCLVNKKGRAQSIVKGKRARRALRMYRIWVHTQQNVFPSAEEFRIYNEERTEHTAEIERFLKKPNLEAYMS